MKDREPEVLWMEVHDVVQEAVIKTIPKKKKCKKVKWLSAEALKIAEKEEIRFHRCVDLSLGVIFCSIDLYFCLVSVPYCLDDCGFVVEPEVRKVDSFRSILLSQDCFGYSRLFLYFHTNWEIICSSSVKNTFGSLIGIALNL